MEKRKVSLVQRRNRIGYLFIAPFVIGFLFFLLIPIIQSILFSFNEIKLSVGGYSTSYVSFKNYNKALFVDPTFRMRLVESLSQTFASIISIITFSFFCSLILNQKFRGRTLARIVFFLPVIISNGIMLLIDNSNSVLTMMMKRMVVEAGGITSSFSLTELAQTLLGSILPVSVGDFIVSTVDSIYGVIISSGMQIIIFICGLNTISPSIYESSNIEGATAWENFWKITFPMMSPYIFLNIVYTVIDSFTNMNNNIIVLIRHYIVSFSNFSFGFAITWIYFSILCIFLGIVTLVVARRVFYND